MILALDRDQNFDTYYTKKNKDTVSTSNATHEYEIMRNTAGSINDLLNDRLSSRPSARKIEPITHYGHH